MQAVERISHAGSEYRQPLASGLTNESAPRALFFRSEQRGIATGSRGVDGDHLLGGKSLEVIRTAGLRPGAGESAAAERLRADDGADHAAIDVDIAMRKPPRDMLDDGIDAGMDAQRERVAVSRKLLEQRVDLARAPTNDVQDRPEHLLSQIFCAVEHDDRRRHISPPRRQRLEAIPTKAHAAFPLPVRDPAVKLLFRLGVDHRPDMGGRLARIAEIELARGEREA